MKPLFLGIALSVVGVIAIYSWTAAAILVACYYVIPRLAPLIGRDRDGPPDFTFEPTTRRPDHCEASPDDGPACDSGDPHA